jgi:hypothetical protein
VQPHLACAFQKPIVVKTRAVLGCIVAHSTVAEYETSEIVEAPAVVAAVRMDGAVVERHGAIVGETSAAEGDCVAIDGAVAERQRAIKSVEEPTPEFGRIVPNNAAAEPQRPLVPYPTTTPGVLIPRGSSIVMDGTAMERHRPRIPDPAAVVAHYIAADRAVVERQRTRVEDAPTITR